MKYNPIKEERKWWSSSKESKASGRKMPIIAIMPPPSVGGIIGAVFLADITKILEPLSKKIYIITTIKPMINSNGKIHTIELKGYREKEPLLTKALKFLLIQLKGSFHLFKISKEVDVVIFHSGSGLYLLPLLAAKLLGKRTIFSASGLYSQIGAPRYKEIAFGFGGIIASFIFKTLEGITFCLSDIILMQSESVINFYGLDRYRSKISIAYTRIIDRSNFKTERNLDKMNLVGYIGRLGGEKGVMNFVKAMPLILKKDKSLRFLIGGDGPLCDEMKNALKMEGIYAEVTFTGWIPHNKVPNYLNQLKLLVLPSYTEGLPGIVLEAMACGTLVLATPVGGVPDLIKDGETGFIMENNSPECIAENVIRVLAYPNLDKIVKNARELVVKVFTYEATVERYRKILDILRREYVFRI